LPFLRRPNSPPTTSIKDDHVEIRSSRRVEPRHAIARAKAVAFEFLRSLESARPEWRASLAFYEVSRDAFVDVLEIDGDRLIRREIVVSTKDLPEPLVRKLFGDPPGANPPKKKALFSVGLGSTPQYTAATSDTTKLMAAHGAVRMALVHLPAARRSIGLDGHPGHRECEGQCVQRARGR
jgi:hypothetical protein